MEKAPKVDVGLYRVLRGLGKWGSGFRATAESSGFRLGVWGFGLGFGDYP